MKYKNIEWAWDIQLLENTCSLGKSKILQLILS